MQIRAAALVGGQPTRGSPSACARDHASSRCASASPGRPTSRACQPRPHSAATCRRRPAGGRGDRGAPLGRLGHGGGVEGVHRRGQPAPVEAEQVRGSAAASARRRRSALGERTTSMPGCGMTSVPAEPAVHHPGGLGSPRDRYVRQRPLQQLDDAVVPAPARSRSRATSTSAAACSAGAANRPSRGSRASASRTATSKPKLRRRQVRRSVHQLLRPPPGRRRVRFQSVTGRGDHIGLRLAGPEHRIDRTVVQPLARAPVSRRTRLRASARAGRRSPPPTTGRPRRERRCSVPGPGR